MDYRQINNWDVTPADAIRIQLDLRYKLVISDDFGDIKTVAGIDVGMYRDEMATAGIVILTFPELEEIETATATLPVEFPYIPGLLSFREAPVILAAFDLIVTEPDLLIFDGQGIAHPRRFGIASHVGIILDRPSIGCGKSRLFGSYEEPGPSRGDSAPLMMGDERIGTVLRTKDNTNPVFISPGHRVSMESATRLALQCTKGYRLPEPTRLAHNLVSRFTPA